MPSKVVRSCSRKCKLQIWNRGCLGVSQMGGLNMDPKFWGSYSKGSHKQNPQFVETAVCLPKWSVVAVASIRFRSGMLQEDARPNVKASGTVLQKVICLTSCSFWGFGGQGSHRVPGSIGQWWALYVQVFKYHNRLCCRLLILYPKGSCITTYEHDVFGRQL